tara:strand:+ start:615 stop:1142 length:528 start_codon:yes stop_codon:yes gene_type:complete
VEWYSVRVFGGKEKKIRDMLLKEIELSGLNKLIRDILVPSENVVEMRKGKKVVKDKLFYPGYLLVNMDLNNESKHFIENMSGVMSFVGPKGNPAPLKEDEVTRILGEVKSKEGTATVSTKYRVGDAIKINDGPFIDFTGMVQEVTEDKQKLKVSVSIFGRPTPVEVDFLQVEHEK